MTLSSIKRKRIDLALLALLVLAAGVRFYNLTDRGIFEYDEAWYLLEAKSLYDAASYYEARFRGDDVGRLKEYLKERGDAPITSFKPAHTLLILAGMLVFGPQDYASFAVSALLGTLTVLLVYHIGRLLYEPRVGRLAALILALSPLHVGYARSGMAQANSLFFVALGFYLWVKSRRGEPTWQSRVGAGGALGLAFTCHFNLFTIPVVFGALDLLLPDARRETWKDRFRHALPFATGMALPPLLFELPARVLGVFGRLPDGQLTYFEQYAYRGSLAGKLSLSPDGGLALLQKLFVHEGPIVAIGLLAAVWALLRLRNPADRIVGAVFLVPVLPWSVLTVGLPPLWRTFAVAIIPVSLLAARGWSVLSDRLPIRLPAPIPEFAVATLVAASGAVLLQPLLSATSGYRAATKAWVQRTVQDGGVIDVFPGSSWPIWYFYLSSSYEGLSPGARQHVRFYPGETDPIPPPGNYDVVDGKRLMRAYGQGRVNLQGYLSNLTRSGTPVVSVPNPVARLPLRFGEVAGPDARQLHRELRRVPGFDQIAVYDLRVTDHASVTAYRNSNTDEALPDDLTRGPGHSR